MITYQKFTQFAWRKLVFLCLIMASFSTTQAQNLAQGKPVVTSSNYSSSYAGNKAVDGILSASSKWTSAAANVHHWMYIDLQSSYNINSVKVKHAGAAGEAAHFNLQAYQIQYWNSGWQHAASINNTHQQSITSSSVSFSARYVRIYITDPGIDNIARVPEVEIYSTPANTSVLNPSGDSHLAWPFHNSAINCSNRMQGSGGWYVTCSTNCGAHKNGDYYADDWVTAYGTMNKPMYSPISGTIIYADWVNANTNPTGDPLYGRQVVVLSSQNNTFAFRVAHLETISVSVGNTVSEGDLLGYIGSTGNSDGPHAHTVLYRNLSTWARNHLSLGGYLSSSYYAAPFYFDAACLGARVTNTNPEKSVKKQVIMEGLHKVDPTQKLAVFPNPIRSNSVARFSLGTDSEVSLAVYDLSGRKVKTLINSEQRQAGETRVELNNQGLKSGMYILILKTGDRQQSIKIKVMK